MKKLLCLLMTAIMMCHLAITCFAVYVYEAENNSFTIELPDDFDEVEAMKFIGDDGSNMGVSVVAYTEEDDGYCIADMTEAELRERAQIIADVSEAAFASVNREGSMEIISVEKSEHKNGYNAVVMEFKTTAKGSEGDSVRYQKVCEFTCQSNIYTFTYTSREGGGIDDMDASFDSIVINEAENKGLKGEIIQAIQNSLGFILIFGLLIFGIIRFMRKSNRH